MLSLFLSLFLMGYVAHIYKVDPYENIERFFEIPMNRLDGLGSGYGFFNISSIGSNDEGFLTAVGSDGNLCKYVIQASLSCDTSSSILVDVSTLSQNGKWPPGLSWTILKDSKINEGQGENESTTTIFKSYLFEMDGRVFDSGI